MRLVVAACFILAGCTSTADRAYVERIRQLADASSPACTDRGSCDALWSAAQEWVQNNPEAHAVKIEADRVTLLFKRRDCLFRMQITLAGFALRSHIEAIPHGFIAMNICPPSTGEHIRIEFNRAITAPREQASAHTRP